MQPANNSKDAETRAEIASMMYSLCDQLMVAAGGLQGSRGYETMLLETVINLVDSVVTSAPRIKDRLHEFPSV